MAGAIVVLALSSLDGTNGFRISGVSAYDQSGASVASAGDVNGDGIDDLIIGAPAVYGVGPLSGASYVVFGKVGGFAANLDLATLDGTNGFRISGETPSDFSGRSVASAGDVNGDGIDDLIIGAAASDANGFYSGSSYVVFGSDTGFAATIELSGLDGTNGFRIDGAAAGDFSGYSVASAGDVNGDGIGDLIIGANQADATADQSGASYVVFGSEAGFGAALDLASLDGTDGFRISGVAAGDRSGFSVASAGDINGDEIDDLVIGARFADPNGASTSGESYVVFGSDAGFDAEFLLSSLDGTNGFRITGVAGGDNSGWSVASAGDFNGDGFGDLIIGAAWADPNGEDSGASYLVFGSDAGFEADLDLSDLDGTNGVRINGSATYDSFGSSVASLGDFNGDGFDDLIIGAYGADVNGLDAGASYVIFGSDAAFAANLNVSSLDGINGFRIDGVSTANRSGGSVASAGDFNDDGFDDILIGASQADNTGVSYVIFGHWTAVSFTGTAGDDTSNGGAGTDALSGLGGADTLNGLDGNDVLDGGDGDDILGGGAGGDRLDGGTGADAMTGGAGSDTYFVDDAADTTTEFGGEGSDRVRTSVTYALAANLENLTLDGIADIDGTGNASANVIDGNSGNNLLSGGDGNDLIKAGLGGDIVNGDAGADQLLGDGGDDIVNGGADNDRLDGGVGADTLNGGDGQDILTGDVDDDTLNGDAGNDQLFGDDGTDILNGGTGNDQLNGGIGADAMTGGTGDDTFTVDEAGDTTIEGSSGGTDTVRASLSWTLADNVERLILLGSDNLGGTGNGLANILTGNGGVNTLDGAGGNDQLNGGLGADTLIGGTGNDILVGGGGADAFVVLAASVFTSSDPQGRTLESDTISDFSTVQGDVIDLSAIDADAGGADDPFTLVGAFSREAGQMTLKFAGGITTLSLDVDGDGRADYQLKINGNVTADSGGWVL